MPLRAGMAGAFVGVIALAAVAGCTGSPNPRPSTSAISEPSSPTSPPAPEAALASFYDQRVTWSGCGGSFECAKVSVPLDYADPQGGSLQLDVVKRPADGDDRLGSLVLNPGGPGSSGVEYARAGRLVVTEQVLEAYDLVGFDPRGVVGSNPVDCLDDAELGAFIAVEGTPDTAAEVTAVADLSAAMGQGCKERSPEIAPAMDTDSAARDMDVLRAVLGDQKLSFLGKSYGSYLGAKYAEMFPTRVGRFVLDGVLPASLDRDEVLHGQAVAFEVALRRFVTACITDEDCPLPRDVDQGVARIQQFLADLDQNPLPGIGERKLTEALGANAVLSYLYFPPDDWLVLEYGLSEAFRGDGSVLMDMLDERLQRNPDGTFQGNGNEAFYAVSCLDSPSPGGVEHARELGARWASDAPTFGTYLAWSGLPCYQWPAGSAAPSDPQPIVAEGAGPILVVSTRFDPATPYDWGVQVADELADARLLSYEGDGHTAYLSGSTCIDKAVDAYLLRGQLPAEGASCPSVTGPSDVF